MGVKPDVTLAGEESLRYACGVQAGSGDVQDSHEKQPAHLTHGGGLQEALSNHKVQRGDDSTEPQTHKHTSSDSTILWRGEEIALGYCDGGDAQDTHHYQVYEAGLRRAVEGVIQPRYKTAHDQERNA